MKSQTETSEKTTVSDAEKAKQQNHLRYLDVHVLLVHVQPARWDSVLRLSVVVANKAEPVTQRPLTRKAADVLRRSFQGSAWLADPPADEPHHKLPNHKL